MAGNVEHPVNIRIGQEEQIINNELNPVPPLQEVAINDANDQGETSQEEQTNRLLAELERERKRREEEEALSKDKFLKKLHSLKPKGFGGSTDPTILENWIRSFEKLFKAVCCPPQWQLDFAIYHLEGEADLWWSTVEERADDSEFGWDEFKELIREHCYPESLRDHKVSKFLNLKQGSMTVVEYATKFTTLLRFASSFYREERQRQQQFHRGLNWKLRTPLVSQRFISYQEL